MVWTVLRAAGTSAVITLSAGVAGAQQIEGLHGEAAEALAAELAQSGFLEPMVVNMFYGDLTGSGSNDAVALIYHPTGGNSEYLDTWLLWESGGTFEVVKDSPLQEIIGDSARDVSFAPGRVAVTMTVMNPGDPRCCPTGEKRFEIVLDGSGAEALETAAPSAGGGVWNVTQIAAPVGVEVAAVALDGLSRITGSCTAGAEAPGFQMTFFDDGEALGRGEQVAEELLLEITRINDVQSFSARVLYDDRVGGWVADSPLPEAFLNAFAAGNAMTVRGARGELARFGMSGTNNAVWVMREACDGGVIGAPAGAVVLPFADGRYLSDPSLCGLDDDEIVARIGDEIHYVLYVIENGQVGGAESLCHIRDVDRSGDLVRMDAACEMEGSVTAVTFEMSYLSETAFRAVGRIFERCE